MLRAGSLVGTDKFGNKYWEDTSSIHGRHRWVEYSRPDYDASDIPAEWHLWVHHFADESPVSLVPPSSIFKLDHIRNATGDRNRSYLPTGHFLSEEFSRRESPVEPWDHSAVGK